MRFESDVLGWVKNLRKNYRDYWLVLTVPQRVALMSKIVSEKHAIWKKHWFNVRYPIGRLVTLIDVLI